MTQTTGLLASCMALLWLGTAHATPTTQQKCEQAKLKAQGKYQLCLKKSSGDVRIGKGDASAECVTKFNAAIQKADNKAAALMASCRYIDNGDGTVSDLNTGLMWEQKDSLGGVHDKDNEFPWTSTPLFLYVLNYGESSDGVDSATACFAGHCDWRLPTVQELQGILLHPFRCSNPNPCIDSTFGSTESEVYWSATTLSTLPSSVWGVDFSDSSVYFYPKSESHYTRAVRGGL